MRSSNVALFNSFILFSATVYACPVTVPVEPAADVLCAVNDVSLATATTKSVCAPAVMISLGEHWLIKLELLPVTVITGPGGPVDETVVVSANATVPAPVTVFTFSVCLRLWNGIPRTPSRFTIDFSLIGTSTYVDIRLLLL